MAETGASGPPSRGKENLHEWLAVIAEACEETPFGEVTIRRSQGRVVEVEQTRRYRNPGERR